VLRITACNDNGKCVAGTGTDTGNTNNGNTDGNTNGNTDGNTQNPDTTPTPGNGNDNGNAPVPYFLAAAPTATQVSALVTISIIAAAVLSTVLML